MGDPLSRRSVLLASSAAALMPGTALAQPANSPQPAPDNHLSRVQARTEQGRWEDYCREGDTSTDTVYAVEFTLNQATAGTSANLMVISDILTIDGAIKSPGKNITLVARQIVCTNDAIVETSGAPAGSTVDRAPDGRSPGSQGGDGHPGGPGNPAGSITIVASELLGSVALKANGGAGAKGQKGGTGGVGQTGPVGIPATRDHGPGNGGQGAIGGPGGKGGDAGVGGDSGQITVLSLNGPLDLKTEAMGGTAGQVGDPGDGGPGGAGGSPGNPTYFQPPRGRPGHEGSDPGGPATYNDKGHPGPTGPTGPKGPVNSTLPHDGANKSPIAKITDIDTVASYTAASQLRMILLRAYADFASQIADRLLPRLMWVYQCAGSPRSGSAYFDARSNQAGSPKVGRPSRKELDGLKAQAGTYLDRVRLGLDVFGDSPNYVSLLSSAYIASAVSARFAIATEVEDAHDKFLDNLSSLKDAADHFNASLATVSKSQDQLIKDSAESESQANLAQDEIEKLDQSASALSAQLQAANYRFTNAIIARGGGGCSIGQMIEFVAGVIAVCYGCYAGAMAIASSMKTVNAGDSAGPIKDIEVLVDTFDKSKVVDDFKRMQDGFEKVRDALKTGNTKIMVSLESFEEQLKPYLDLPEAVDYRDLMRQFVDLSKTKNDKLLAYTQYVLKAADAHNQSITLGLEADRLKQLLSDTSNPSLVDFVSFLTGYLGSLKVGLVELLDLQRRSLIYATLVPIKPSYQTARIIELKKSQDDLDTALFTATQRRGGEELTFSSEYKIIRTEIPWIFKSLHERGQAFFSIPLNAPDFNRGGTSFVTVIEVGLKVEGLKTRGGLWTCRLTHQGSASLRNADDGIFNFTHPKRATILSYQLSNGSWTPKVAVDNNLRGSDRFLFLSPFATWFMEFEDLNQLDFSGVSELIFMFKGHSIPANRPGLMSDFRKMAVPN